MQQRTVLAPPLAGDKELTDFASVLQSNFDDLFQSSHNHALRNTAPSNNEGNVGDMVPVNIVGTYYLYIKTSSTAWKRVLLS
jgi:hypothetical protein